MTTVPSLPAALSNNAAFGAVAAIALFCYVVQHRLRARGRPPNFPGPRPLPFLGNVLQMPKENWSPALHKLGLPYGPIYSLSLFGRPLLVVSSTEAARELFEAKSTLYTNRPLPKMAELSGFDTGVVLQHDTHRWRAGRKLMHRVLQPREMPRWREAEEHHLRTLLLNLLNNPDDFASHTRHVSTGLSLEIAYGYRVKTQHDEFVERSDVSLANFGDAFLIQHMVDWFPSLATLPRWLPGMGFMKKAEEYKKQYFQLVDDGLDMVKRGMANGTAKFSLGSITLAESEKEKTPEDLIKFNASEVFIGGGDSLASLLQSLIYFMITHRDWQARAFAEIRAVVGTGAGRLPALTDRERLPVVGAIIAEVARLRPPVSMFYRVAAEDDVHRGHFIAKNTIIFANIWAMLRDDSVYLQPHDFVPGRWLKPEAPSTKVVYDTLFGFGRRYCPGRLIGEEMLFLSASRILALFEMSYARDVHGKEIIPSGAMTRGGISRPELFPCTISPRQPGTADIINAF
ncbi:cytochrome P450 [Epithele typhae]|uniref:cytochrome P450 n=1 Tax=Epithele typhae TaxID=378194 RepID=UPI0020076CCB|nr:cytochrome P450 [Epithele typhae]KAH9940064.1 cytochrome P450 [Epithele typhae]